MNMTSCSSSSSSASSLPRLCATKSQTYKSPLLSFSTPKRRRSRPRRNRKFNGSSYDNSDGNLLTLTTSSPAGNEDQSLSLTLDVNRISKLANSRFQLFLDSSKDAFSDLQTLIALDDNRRVVVSCKKSTMQFVGGVVVLGLVFGFAIRVLVKLGSVLKGNFQSNPKLVVRRDRSLGGKEVVVSVDSIRSSSRPSNSSIASDQVSPSNSMPRRNHQLKSQNNLPKWWPASLPSSHNLDLVDKEEYQREANRIVRGIEDNRTSGRDITDNDIIQLRRVCRISGVQISFEPTNTRDSFYRTSIDFVLNACSRAPWESSSVEICSEDAREFIAGLAENIGLAKIDAARMVSAAVAARTRSWFLQAWALEIQGKHSESAAELSKICLIHRIFPPNEYSAEMEMVARGLEKLMKLEERQSLLKTFVGMCCSEDSQRSAAEALGLVHW
ncbi:PREDICTED: uncharacterized protein LOC104793254 isoform X2 [Camelina sativa]|uniref:Uncharacterized protein LOC104793254 isoform X2 n=1 Tax=Camelina sativa TaxID=90675 RepID=A0ABM0ZML5_CAMSA|nr:PREDICTED: uncharacterized protein LOC104793254 isoform X2 [Camelina sativa]